ncbi:MAG: 2-oxoacid:acceptor oxidoreductase family protein, partial [Candidatus Thorarchaeota archaeon]|nr:2-oxoacid:acceptor oxidoreductase family protein [Candidatus Thorarchaeota archaeon]
DPDLVNIEDIKGYEVVKVPAMKTADEMGMRLVSNMVMLGAFVKKSGVFPIEVLEKTLATFVSKKYLQADIDAVRAGAKLV